MKVCTVYFIYTPCNFLSLHAAVLSDHTSTIANHASESDVDIDTGGG